jgi:signal peptidase I
MKYLYSVYDPKRFDVVVFKNPSDPTINYIKRLVGLPGDEIAIVDGDIFVRTPSAGEPHDGTSWKQTDWRTASKPKLAQRSMWQPIFSSEYTPVKPALIGRAR